MTRGAIEFQSCFAMTHVVLRIAGPEPALLDRLFQHLRFFLLLLLLSLHALDLVG